MQVINTVSVNIANIHAASINQSTTISIVPL